MIVWPAALIAPGAGNVQSDPTWGMMGYETPEQEEPVGIVFQRTIETREDVSQDWDQTWKKAHGHGPLHLRELATHRQRRSRRATRDVCKARVRVARDSLAGNVQTSGMTVVSGGPRRDLRRIGAMRGRYSLGRPHRHPPRICRSSGASKAWRHLLWSRAAILLP